MVDGSDEGEAVKLLVVVIMVGDEVGCEVGDMEGLSVTVDEKDGLELG